MRKIIAAVAVLAIAAGGYAAWRSFGASHDYRDPAQLSAAVQAHEGANTANCGHVTGNSYVCVVAYSDGHMANYQVTVSADGSSYSTGTP